MNAALFGLIMGSFLSCSSKKTAPPPLEPVNATVQQDDSDCPSGVKIDCNVPSMTKEQIADIQAANQKCVEACILSRQAESIGHDVIASECQYGCKQEHFVGQVQLIPSLDNLEKPKGEAVSE